MTNARDAARLLSKGLQLRLAPANDLDYRELLARYRADPSFRETVQDMAIGLELRILDQSERGIVLCAADARSQFALRLGDLRQNLRPEQRVALVLAHLAIGATFFPTADSLEDDAPPPVPVKVSRFRDSLSALVKRLEQERGREPGGEDHELDEGWRLLSKLPVVNPKAERAAPNSLEGFVKLALNQMADSALVRLDRTSADESQEVFTATHRLRVQLREATVPAWFEIARSAMA